MAVRGIKYKPLKIGKYSFKGYLNLNIRIRNGYNEDHFYNYKQSFNSCKRLMYYIKSMGISGRYKNCKIISIVLSKDK